MRGDSRRCPIGRHAYVTEQNSWLEADGTLKHATRWKCWSCGHWQTSPPIGTMAHRARLMVRELAARDPEGHARMMADITNHQPKD